MIQMPVSPHCNCCGLPINLQLGEDCPRCKYPVNLAKEERFLESSLHDLQRVAAYGGVNMTIGGLIHRYQSRLNYLRYVKSGAVLESRQAQATPPPRPVPPQVPSAAIGGVKPPVHPQEKPSIALPSNLPTPPAGKKVGEASSQRPAASSSGALHPPVCVPAREEPVSGPAMAAAKTVQAGAVQERTFSFSLKSFVIDQAITIIGLLGAFLILIGALSSVITTSNSLLSFLVVFGVHAFFGVAGIIAFRFANFRLIARIYTGIYTLLVPLVGFTAYNLLSGGHTVLSAPTLVVIAAVYATIVYVLLAIYERFVIFGYLGAMALIVADFALAADLHLSYWWWPGMLMLLALPALLAIIRNSTSDREKFFTGSLAILRAPVCVFMYVIVSLCLLSSICIAAYSFLLDSSSAPLMEVRYALLCMTVLLLAWTSLFFWLTKRTQSLHVLAALFLACVLAACYAFDFTRGGYVLVLTGTALLYHGFNRLAGHRLAPVGKFSLRLDQIALLLISIVPFVAAWQLPQQLLCSAYHLPSTFGCALLQADWETVAGLLAVGVGCLLSISIILWQADLTRTAGSKSQHWLWLLLLSGFLLTWEYSVFVLVLHVEPVWSFAGLVVTLMITAVVVRSLFGTAWSRPLEVVILAEMLLTLVLSLSQRPGSIAVLLLVFAALIYVALLYQKRASALFLPLIFAVLALPLLLFVHPFAVLLMGLALPLIAVVVHWIMQLNIPVIRNARGQPKRATVWEWPLLALGLLYGGVIIAYDQFTATSIIQHWLQVTCPVAIEIAAFALVWYVAAALVRVKWWLLPVTGFAIAALLLPTNMFWVLFGVAPVSALLALGISRVAGRTWAAPLYIAALLSAIMSGIAAEAQGQLLAASWTLLAFGLLAYILALAEDQQPLLWLLPAFNIWALVVAARVGDLYRPPTVALAYAAVGVAIGCLNIIRKPAPDESWRNRFLAYALPFYTTACAAAILTGVYGMLPGAQPPFYGAIPDALLIYALAAFGVVLFERQPRWLWLVAAFATWGTLLATRLSLTYVIGIGLGVGLLGLLLGQVIKRLVGATADDRMWPSWGWPWYLGAVFAALVTGCWPYLGTAPQPFAGFIEYSLLVFAVLFYVIGIVEDAVAVLWLGSLFAAWSLVDSAFKNDFYRLFTIALVYTALGVLTSSLKFFPTLLNARRVKTLHASALPFYATALLAGICSGYVTNVSGNTSLFYGLVPAALPLLVYAGIVYAVSVFERQPTWLIIAAGLGIWGTLLTSRLNIAWPIGIAIDTALFGLVIGYTGKKAPGASITFVSGYNLSKLIWSWPWYLISLMAMLLTIVEQNMPGLSNAPWFMTYSLLAFTTLAIIVMLVERTPELLVLPVGLAAWTIWQWQPQPGLAMLMVAYSLLSVLIYVTQFVWKVLLPSTHWLSPTFLHRVLAIGGQILLVLVIIANGGLSADSGLLAFVGTGSLCVLALLVFCYGYVQDNCEVQRYYTYAAGLLSALSISWLLVAFRQVNIDLLLLAPATYLILIAPLLMHDERLPQHRLAGQAAAVLGTALLLLPTVWLSFSNGSDNLIYTLVLLGEALVLLLLGIGVGVRVFVLTAAGLIVIGAIHALFLQTHAELVGPLLIISGVAVVAIATLMTVFFQRLKTAWKQWD